STGGAPRVHAPRPGENVSDWAPRYSSGVARGSGAGGAAPGREPGGEVSRALREHRGVPGSTEGAPTAKAGESAETSTESGAQLDERFRSAQESTLGGDPGGGEGPGPAGHGVGGGGVFWRLTSVALRAPSVSRPKERAELSTLLRLGTFYFALTELLSSFSSFTQKNLSIRS